MDRDIFGNLEDWGRVLEQLAELSHAGQIEPHQESLARLLRYQGNWRLREAALEAIPAIRRPTANLIREVCNVMMDDGLYFQVRVLAAEALGAMVDRAEDRAEAGSPQPRQQVREQMHALLNSHQPPVIHQAARRILPKVE